MADVSLSWWTSYKKAMGINVVNSMAWGELKKLMIKEYSPREEMHKLEQEMWNLTMKEANVSTYTNYFNELATLYPGMVTTEYKIERYIWCLL